MCLASARRELKREGATIRLDKGLKEDSHPLRPLPISPLSLALLPQQRVRGLLLGIPFRNRRNLRPPQSQQQRQGRLRILSRLPSTPALGPSPLLRRRMDICTGGRSPSFPRSTVTRSFPRALLPLPPLRCPLLPFHRRLSCAKRRAHREKQRLLRLFPQFLLLPPPPPLRSAECMGQGQRRSKIGGPTTAGEERQTLTTTAATTSKGNSSNNKGSTAVGRQWGQERFLALAEQAFLLRSALPIQKCSIAGASLILCLSPHHPWPPRPHPRPLARFRTPTAPAAFTRLLFPCPQCSLSARQ